MERGLTRPAINPSPISTTSTDGWIHTMGPDFACRRKEASSQASSITRLHRTYIQPGRSCTLPIHAPPTPCQWPSSVGAARQLRGIVSRLEHSTLGRLLSAMVPGGRQPTIPANPPRPFHRFHGESPGEPRLQAPRQPDQPPLVRVLVPGSSL